MPAQAASGALSLERQEYLRAVLAYRRLTNALPNNAGAHYNLGLALWGHGLNGQAVSALRRARSLYFAQDDLDGVDRVEALLDFWGIEDEE